MLEQARARAGAAAEPVALGDYARAVEAVPDRDAPVIALIQGVGQIQRGDSDYGALDGWVMGADTVATALADAIDDPEVRRDPVPDQLRLAARRSPPKASAARSAAPAKKASR